MHRVPAGMLSMSLMLNSPCFVNLHIGAPMTLSISVLTSIHGLLSSAAKAFAAFLTIAVFPSVCRCWSFNTSSVVRTFLLGFISQSPFADCRADSGRRAIAHTDANFLDCLVANPGIALLQSCNAAPVHGVGPAIRPLGLAPAW